MNLARHTAAIAMAVTFAALAGCASTAQKSASSDKSLYDRLGGKPAIVAVVDDFVANVAADSRINGRFANADIGHLKAQLVDQICAGTGGPCKYTGKDMKAAHAGMRIQEAEFGALVEDLGKSLDKFKVPKREQSDLVVILGPMKGDVVNQ